MTTLQVIEEGGLQGKIYGVRSSYVEFSFKVHTEDDSPVFRYVVVPGDKGAEAMIQHVLAALEHEWVVVVRWKGQVEQGRLVEFIKTKTKSHK